MAEERKKNDKGEQDLQVLQWKNPLLLIILLLNTVTMGAIGFFQYQSHQKEKNRPSIQDIVESAMMEEETRKNEGTLPEDELGFRRSADDGILLSLDGFTANLAQGDGPRRFVRLNIVLKFSPDSEEGEFRSRRPQIRDSIISILNAKRPTDLLKREGKEYLKEEIKASINSFLVDGKVVSVYYVGFQIN